MKVKVRLAKPLYREDEVKFPLLVRHKDYKIINNELERMWKGAVMA
jgi:hypothetical protein